MPAIKGKIYRLKIVLDGSEPLIWRKILVKSDIKLSQLHDIIQTVMGWTNSHLHHFRTKDCWYVMQGELDNHDSDAVDERKAKLCDIVARGQSFLYEYDFGDSWMHIIKVEAVLEPEAGVKYPACVGGAMACPPDDVGGLDGYYNFIEALKDPKHEDHEDMVEWHGEDFDPSKFELRETNMTLHPNTKVWQYTGDKRK